MGLVVTQVTNRPSHTRTLAHSHTRTLTHSHGFLDRIPHWLSRKNIMGR